LEADSLRLEDLLVAGKKQAITVRQAICDLPSPKLPKDEKDFDWSSYPPVSSSMISEYAKAMRAPPPKNLGWSIAVERFKQGFISGLLKTRHSREISRRYARISGGKSDPITRSYKLDWDGHCPTLRAGTGPDRGSFQAVRPLHPGKGRVITVREAARLQGFPDWFVFHPTKWHSFRMIGNSVSPVVAQAVLAAIGQRF
jgi:DNA (cytosine-5)-methyltransferase 1